MSPVPPALGRLSDWRVHAALAVVQLAFASQAVEGKIVMGAREAGGEGVPPLAVAMVRMLGAAIFFQIFTRATGLLRPTTSGDQRVLAGLSVAGIVLNQVCFLVGLRLTTPMTAALLSVTIPVFAAVMAVAARQERASVRLGAGLAAAIGGVVWITGVHKVDKGALVVVANCLSYAVYIVYSRATIRRLGALSVITWVFTWASALFAPIGLPALLSGAPTWTARGWGFLVYILIVPTIVAYLATAWALAKSTATLVTVYAYTQPVLTALLAWVQLGQTVTSRLIGAAALIVTGVSLVATRSDARPAPIQEE